MRRLEFGYGTGVQAVEVPEENLVGVLMANEMEHPLRGAEAVRAALAQPIGAPRLRETVRPGQTVAIVVSDISRPVPSSVLLPPLLEELRLAGIPAEHITIVFALGSHRHHTPEEQRRRILARNGERAEMFFTRWIPFEERYFREMDVERRCDLVIHND